MHRLQELVRLHRLGDGPREVARKLQLSPNTERMYRKAFMAADVLSGSPEDLPTLEVLKNIVDKHREERPLHKPVSSIERWRALVKALHDGGAGPTAIFDRLKLEHESFAGSLSAVKRMVASIKREQGPQSEDIAVPIMTKPGEVAQVDFGDVGKLWDPHRKKLRKAYVFVMTLSYSRHMFAKVVFDQKVDTWLLLHAEAFEFFEGVPRVVVPDNLKSAVIRAAFDVRTEPVLNQSYRDFARHFGFKVDPTPPYNPEKKGKVENSVKYVKGNFFKTIGDETNADTLNKGLRKWILNIAGLRCHGTTHRKPLEHFAGEEQVYLLSLPKVKWESLSWRACMVHRDACVLVEKARYSVPWRLVGRKLRVLVSESSVQVYWNHTRVATHPRVSAGEQSILLAHLPESRGEHGRRDRGYWLERAEAIGEDTRRYIQELFESDEVLEQMNKAQSIVRFLDKFPPKRANAACARASYWGSYSYAAIKRILEKGLDMEPLPVVTIPESTTTQASKYARTALELLESLDYRHDAPH